MDLKNFISNLKVKTPVVNIQGSRRTNTPEVELPQGSVFLNNRIDQAQGNVGLGVVTQVALNLVVM